MLQFDCEILQLIQVLCGTSIRSISQGKPRDTAGYSNIAGPANTMHAQRTPDEERQPHVRQASSSKANRATR
jgi:hypothetical protein